MNEKDNVALVPRPPGALEKAEPGAKRILSDMVADTLALVRAKTPPQSAPALVEHGSEDLEELNRRGNAYYAGMGVQKDDVEAVKWYRLAAERGYAPAQFNLACCYAHGQGVVRDYFGQAMTWYLKAAEQGHALAQYAFYRYRYDSSVPSDEEAAGWLKKSAEQGYYCAQFELGFKYQEGQSGFPQDHNQAATWYHKAAEQSSTSGVSSLRYCYDHSLTYFQDPKTEAIAEACVRKLAKYSLGCCYREGRGVAKDKVEAFKWFALAFEQKVSREQTVSRPTAEELASLQAELNPAELAESQRRCDEFKRRSANAAETPPLAGKRHNREDYSAAQRTAPASPKESPK